MEIRGIKKIQAIFKDKVGYLKKEIELKRLEKYEDIISSVLAFYRKKSCDETMMVKGTRKFDATTTNRETHQMDVAGVVQIAAKQIGLNDRIAKIIAENHDIGHTFLGHSGEWWISNRLEKEGLGVFCHNALRSKGFNLYL